MSTHLFHGGVSLQGLCAECPWLRRGQLHIILRPVCSYPRVSHQFLNRGPLPGRLHVNEEHHTYGFNFIGIRPCISQKDPQARMC